MARGLDVETVLVTVDGSDEADEAVEYAVAVADRYDASVHAMFVLRESATRALESGSLDGETAAAEAQAVLEAAVDAADRAGVDLTHSTAVGFSTTRKLVHPGSVILDAAEQIDADFLVVPRESGLEADDVLEKAAEYVLSYASQPVLSV